MKNLLIIALIVLMSGCSIVGPGERGIRISLGKASAEAKEPGAYLWIPFLFGMAKTDIQLQKSDVKTSAASKDMQEITTDVAVNWSVSPEKVVQVYKNLGDESDIYNRVIAPSVSEVLKASMAQLTAEEILGKRLELKSKIDEALRVRLQPYGVVMTDLNIVNLQFSQEFTHAIEQKQIAEQKAYQAKYVAKQAEADAQAEINRAKGQAEAQRLLKATITPEILRKMAIEKWDGKFPQVMGSGTVPFLNLKMGEP